jgi:lactate permease
MPYVLACLPILVVLGSMLGLRCGAHKAGAAGIISAGIIGLLFFGLTPEVICVSQMKGALLSFYVLAVMWPALFLFHWLNTTGSIAATAHSLRRVIPERGMCALVMAWSLSGVFEGVAGFGLPVAIVSPMLVAIGIGPVTAVAAVAIGHSWAVTFGSMGIIFQTLVTITGMEPLTLVPWSALLLGAGCIGCGIASSFVLGQLKKWPFIVLVGAIMAGVQYLLCRFGLTALGSMGAGVAGVLACIAFQQGTLEIADPADHKTATDEIKPETGSTVRPALLSYGALGAIMGLLAFWPALRTSAETFSWAALFPAVATSHGFETAAGRGPVFRPLTHPGSLVTMVTVLAVITSFASDRPKAQENLRFTIPATMNSGGTASLGILFMVGLAALMDHCGMTLLLAKAVSAGIGAAYPAIAPFIGVLGAFATGSNNNSNIMFAELQKNAAAMIHMSPAIILAAQTAGGSLGSMIAPAKLVIGCSTTGRPGQEGAVLRKTLLPMIVIVLVIGCLTLAAAILVRSTSDL